MKKEKKNTWLRLLSMLLLVVFYMGFRSDVLKAETLNSVMTYAADSSKPIIDMESLMLSADSGSVGDTITISVKITDNVGVSRASIS